MVQIIAGNPFNDRHTNRITESKQSLVKRHFDYEIIRPHQAGALTRGQQPDGEPAFAGGKQNLTATAAPGGAKTPGNPIGAKFSHGFFVAHPAENGAMGDLCTKYHPVRRCTVLWAHLVEQIITALPAPPHF